MGDTVLIRLDSELPSFALFGRYCSQICEIKFSYLIGLFRPERLLAQLSWRATGTRMLVSVKHPR